MQNTCYYGLITVDCKPCMCPGNVIESATNVFATTCELQSGTGTSKCNNCTVGHGGDQCDICVQGYYGVPTDPTVSTAPVLFAFELIWVT